MFEDAQITVADLTSKRAFFETVLGAVGCSVVIETEGLGSGG